MEWPGAGNCSPHAEPLWAAGAGAGAQQSWVFRLSEPCRQIHGRNSWISILLAEKKEGGGRGRKKQDNRVAMVLSTGAKLFCGTCADTGNATPKHFPVSHTHTAVAKATGQD